MSSLCPLRFRFLPTSAAALCAVLTLSCGGNGDDPPPPPRTCTAGAGVQAATCAAQGTHQHAAAVDDAIDVVISQHPEYFDMTQGASTREYMILDKIAYRTAVVGRLVAGGLCAEADTFSDRRIKVKESADFHEDYNITSIDYGDGAFIQWGAVSYDTTCTPAAFPLAVNPDVPPPDQGCGVPYPPPIDDFGTRILVRAGGVWTLDSTPRIRDINYCRSIGFTDGRSFCPLRDEGSPERVPCENWRVGTATDTGRVGPTWRRDGQLCTGQASGCANSAHNQLQLLVYPSDGAEHAFTACTPLDACGELAIAH